MGVPTLAITTIVGGSKTNVIPDRCVATVDWRTVPGQSHADLLLSMNELMSEMKKTIADFHCEVRVLANRPPVETSPGSEIVRAALRAGRKRLNRHFSFGTAPYFTDASVLSVARQTPTLIWGPGDETQAHQTNESIDVTQVVLATELYTELAVELLG
jgi:succinyl-diaminopimelate desuccinylase